eukprot:gene8475-10409_t
MVKVERKKDLLKWFNYGRIKSDISYQVLMKKTGGNGKGYLDRFFVLHRNYLIYYKPGKTDSKPEDNQEPQGYINLGDCILDETKTLFKTTPLTFQIATKVGRVYLIRAKEERLIEQLLTLIRPRIKALNHLMINDLGNVEENMKTISNLLPRKMRLPDRVKPNQAMNWISEMAGYYKAYRDWEPYLMKVEQFSEVCYGATKQYIDWFVSSEGPRLSMIRCEELVLDNWVEYIKKTMSEISTYDETRFFSEDFQDIIQHLKNMITLIDCCNLYMRECHKNVKYVDKYLEEKQILIQHLQTFTKIPSRSQITFDSASNTDSLTGDVVVVEGSIKGNTKNPDLSPDAQEWRYQSNVLQRVGSNAQSNPERWRFEHGCFIGEQTNNNQLLGSILWNNKTWQWSHPKTDYKIRFDWDPVSHSFVYYQPKLTTSISLHSSGTASTGTKASLSKRQHPQTVYADWKLVKNTVLQSVVIGNKSEPFLTNLEVEGVVPLPAMLIVAMSHQIKEALEFLLPSTTISASSN